MKFYLFICILFSTLIGCMLDNGESKSDSHENPTRSGVHIKRDSIFFLGGNKLRELKVYKDGVIDSSYGWSEVGVLKYKIKIYDIDTIFEFDSTVNLWSDVIHIKREGEFYYDSGKLRIKLFCYDNCSRVEREYYTESGELIKRE